jgi:hypothetical protein
MFILTVRSFITCYASPNIIRMIKSRRMKLAGHVASMGVMKMHARFWSENLKGGDH